ncbi:hypothetical protein [Bacillus sp. RAR_GA_16]|uniref:hypothetical protein n=1 Tax=Bacillus sp. RAR_GA_16 TaxID=2876774 RepID=UPI001CCB5F25|nr:hypothetical protein [Bacillus sp. RAR_GA_16]MCA0173912.1 hypothetical protein [Bacillus sp. RAR_GA_16]
MEKKFPILLASCLLSGSLLAGCGSNGTEDNNSTHTSNNSSMEENTASENEGTNEGMNDSSTDSGSEETIDLDVGVDTALTNLDELKATLENSSDDIGAINEQTMTLEENWDKMEAQVEQEFPDEYKDIEESLYPLIDEGKKDEPDTGKMNELLDETVMKMTEFKEKLPAS